MYCQESVKMRHKHSEKLLYLFLPISLGVIYLSFSYPKLSDQVKLVALTLGLYLGLSLLFHKLDRSLTVMVALEYIIIGILTAVIVGGSLVVF